MKPSLEPLCGSSCTLLHMHTYQHTCWLLQLPSSTEHLGLLTKVVGAWLAPEPAELPVQGVRKVSFDCGCM